MVLKILLSLLSHDFYILCNVINKSSNITEKKYFITYYEFEICGIFSKINIEYLFFICQVFSTNCIIGYTKSL